MTGRAARSTAARLGRLVLGLVPLVVLLGLCELVLALLGLGEGDPAGLALGFDPGVRYLVPDPQVEGGWRTQFRESEDQEVAVPPKGDALRVILFGGSNTQTFPEETLEATLRRDDPAGREWEVVNLGRQGYGSRRVAILVAQALVLEPDLIVVYSGHNEFVEAGFALELDEQFGGAGWRGVAGALSHLRSFRVLSEQLAPAARPGDVVQLDPAAREIPWEQTLERYAAYRANLERIAEMAAGADVPLVLCTVISNLWSPPYVATLGDDLDAGQRARVEQLLHRAEMKIPRPFRVNLRPPRRLKLSSWYAGPGVELERLPRLSPLSGPLEAARPTHGVDHKADSMWGSHWPPPRGWEPRVLEVLATLETVTQRRLRGQQEQVLLEARATLEELLGIAPDHPFAHYDLGLVQWLLGEDAAALASLRAAQRFDRSPHGGNDHTNRIVRELAEQHPGAHLFDGQKLFASRCGSGIPGYELLLDSCHLAPGARVVLMHDLARFLRVQLADRL